MKAIILAGGLGTRLRSVVADLPKPMAPVNGRPFLEHWMGYWARQGIRGFTLCVGHLGEAIRAHFGSSFAGLPVEYSQETRPLGTGGALLQALSARRPEEPFLLLNGDTYFEVGLRELTERFTVTGAELVLALRRARSGGRYGVVGVGDGSRVTGFLPAATGPDEGWINGGVYLVAPGALDRWRDRAGQRLSFEEELLPAQLQDGQRIFALPCEGRFIDIGTPEDYARAPSCLGPEGNK